MTEDVRILLFGPDTDELGFAEAELRRDPRPFLVRRASDRDDFLAAVETFRPDLVLSALELPGMTALDVVKAARDRRPGLPVICVADSWREEEAVDLILAGAKDVVTKDRLPRLQSSIARALTEAEQRNQREKAEKRLREECDRSKRYLDVAEVILLIVDSGAIIRMINRHGCELLGYRDPAEIVGRSWYDFLPSGFTAEYDSRFRRLVAGESDLEYSESSVIDRDGTERVIAWHNVPLQDDQGQVSSILRSGEDITEYREALHQAEYQNRVLHAVAGNAARLGTLKSLDGELCDILGSVGAALDVDRVILVEPGADGGFADAGIVQAWERDGIPVRLAATGLRGQEIGETAIDDWIAPMRQNQPVVVDVDTAPEPLASFLRSKGNRSTLLMPVFAEGVLWGNIGVDSCRAPRIWGQSEMDALRALSEAISALIERKTAMDHHLSSLESIVTALADTMEMRDPYTSGHQKRVAMLAGALGVRLGLSPQQLQGLTLAASIHDIGKIRIPAEILVKPTRLLPMEFELIKSHSLAGADVVRGIDFPWPVADMISQHHERLDGNGYPHGLKEDAILPESRILAVADVVESMMSHRPYRAALGIDMAIAEIERGRGQIFDPAVVDSCVSLFRDDGYVFPA